MTSYTSTLTVKLHVRAETLSRALQLTDAPAASIEDWLKDTFVTQIAPWVGVTVRQDGTTEDGAAHPVRRSLSFRKGAGYKECPGSYMADHEPKTPGIEATCRHCGHAIQTIHYGRNLKTHYVPLA